MGLNWDSVMVEIMYAKHYKGFGKQRRWS